MRRSPPPSGTPQLMMTQICSNDDGRHSRVTRMTELLLLILVSVGVAWSAARLGYGKWELWE